jgi:hypothetical protein
MHMRATERESVGKSLQNSAVCNGLFTHRVKPVMVTLGGVNREGVEKYATLTEFKVSG